MSNKRNIKLKYLITIFFILFSQQFLLGESKLILSPYFLFKTGEINEYVYSKNKQLSQLDWEINSLWGIGFDVNFNFKKLYSALNLYTIFPKNTGLMKDYDWTNSDDTLTHYSEHTNKTESQIGISGFVGVIAYQNNIVSIVPNIGYEFISTTMLASDGFTQYLSQNNVPFSEDKNYVTGDVVRYKQNVDFLWLGTNLNLNIGSRWTIEG